MEKFLSKFFLLQVLVYFYSFSTSLNLYDKKKYEQDISIQKMTETLLKSIEKNFIQELYESINLDLDCITKKCSEIAEMVKVIEDEKNYSQKQKIEALKLSIINMYDSEQIESFITTSGKLIIIKGLLLGIANIVNDKEKMKEFFGDQNMAQLLMIIRLSGLSFNSLNNLSKIFEYVHEQIKHLKNDTQLNNFAYEYIMSCLCEKIAVGIINGPCKNISNNLFEFSKKEIEKRINLLK